MRSLIAGREYETIRGSDERDALALELRDRGSDPNVR